MSGAMLPSTGAAQAHLGDERYWPIYGEASSLGCAIGIHGGAHEDLGMDDPTPDGPVHPPGAPPGYVLTGPDSPLPGRPSAFPRRQPRARQAMLTYRATAR